MRENVASLVNSPGEKTFGEKLPYVFLMTLIRIYMVVTSKISSALGKCLVPKKKKSISIIPHKPNIEINNVQLP